MIPLVFIRARRSRAPLTGVRDDVIHHAPRVYRQYLEALRLRFELRKRRGTRWLTSDRFDNGLGKLRGLRGFKAHHRHAGAAVFARDLYPIRGMRIDDE